MLIEGVTHWSIPVNNLTESEAFYRDVLELEYRGRLANNVMACFSVGGHDILLCERSESVSGRKDVDTGLHHSFTANPERWLEGAKRLKTAGAKIEGLVYREQGFFLGRELYFEDPSGNRLELRDASWAPGMPKPSIEDILAT
jgi:catechol 2,3-dioxygenase-like lactoylglutathione lyase family enzyme